jgi:uncharacterized protein YjiS (DUF1127 family)
MSNAAKRQSSFSAPTCAWTFDEVDNTREQARLKRQRLDDLVAEISNDRVRSSPQRENILGRRLRSIAGAVIQTATTPIAAAKLRVQAIVRWRERRRSAAILYALDDMVLKDIGICRCAIEYIVRQRGVSSDRF